MKVIKITSTAILSLFLGIAAPVYAQKDHDGEKQEHSGKHQDKQKQAKPEQKHAQHHESQGHQDQEHQAQKQQHEQDKQEQHAQQQERQEQNKQQAHERQQKHNAQPQHDQRHVQQAAWQQHRSQSWDSDHRDWHQRGGYSGYRIPQDHYRGYFGPDHGFRIYGRPFLVVGGYPRFQYRGYWISMVDPWPDYWGDNWYDNDDVYVTYVNDGYYLHNRRHPKVGISISISM